MQIQACTMPIFNRQNVNIQRQNTFQIPRYQQYNNVDTVSFGTRIIDKYPKEFLKDCKFEYFEDTFTISFLLLVLDFPCSRKPQA